MFIRIVKLILSAGIYAVDSLRDIHHDVVLYYHGITEREESAFERQMREVALRPHVKVTFDDALESVALRALPVTLQMGIHVTIFVPTGAFGEMPDWMCSSMRKHHLVMSADRIRELSHEKLITWGSHTVTHPRFTALSDDEVRFELRESREVLEALLGIPVIHFSFPHGEYREEHIVLAGDAGYSHVYTIMPDAERIVGHVRVVGRIKVDPSDWMVEFRLKLAGAYRWLPRACAIKRAIVSCFDINALMRRKGRSHR